MLQLEGVSFWPAGSHGELHTLAAPAVGPGWGPRASPIKAIIGRLELGILYVGVWSFSSPPSFGSRPPVLGHVTTNNHATWVLRPLGFSGAVFRCI